MVSPLREGEADATLQAALGTVILHPVVCHHTAWLVSHRPAEDTALSIPDIHRLVVPANNLLLVFFSIWISLIVYHHYK